MSDVERSVSGGSQAEGVREDADRWQSEIDQAEDLRNQHMTRYREMIDRFAGPSYSRQSAVGDRYDPEAYAYEYISLMLPRLVYDNPRIVARTRSSDPGRVAMAIKFQAAMNLWCRLTDMQAVLERIALDYLFFCGVAHVVPDAMPWTPDVAPSALPRICRINPGDFVMDAQASHWSEASWMGHRWVARRRNVLRWLRSRPESEGWDVDAAAAIGPAFPVDAVQTQPPGARPEPLEDMIEIYQIWESGPDSGVMFAVARSVSVDRSDPLRRRFRFIRKPQRYPGPRCGPYIVFGAMAVPQSPWPLSPIMAIDQQITDHNNEVRSVQGSAKAYKRGYLIDGTNRGVAEAMESRTQWVTPTTSLTRESVIPYEIGGVTDAQVKHLEITRARLDRVSGFDDVMRGSITGRATATEVSVAETAARVRIAGIIKTFQASVSRLLWSIGWHLWHDREVRIELGPDVGRQVAEVEPVFTGGRHFSEYQLMDLEIDPYSMQRVSEQIQNQRAMNMVQMVQMITDLMARSPHIRWDRFLRMIDHMTGLSLEAIINQSQLQESQEIMRDAMFTSSTARPLGTPSPPRHERSAG